MVTNLTYTDENGDRWHAVAVMGMFVKAETSMCTKPMGSCESLDCNAVCDNDHPGGAGICDGRNTCNCHYSCSEKTNSTPATDKSCKAAVGKCDQKCNLACCDNICKVYYGKGGVGHCDLNPRGPFFVCNCDYPC